MKREDLKQLAIEAGFYVAGVQEFLVATGLDGTQDHKLRKLISLVEQATLERAAKVCKDKAAMMEREAMQEGCDDEDRTSLRSGAWIISVCGNEILALKDSHD